MNTQADKLEAVAEWFTDCKNLTLEKLPTGLIDALRAGARALRQAEGGQEPQRIVYVMQNGQGQIFGATYDEAYADANTNYVTAVKIDNIIYLVCLKKLQVLCLLFLLDHLILNCLI